LKRPAVCLIAFHPYPMHPQVRRDSEVLTEAGYDVTLVVRRLPGQPARERVDRVTIHRLPVEHRRGSWLRYVREYLLFLSLAFIIVSWLHLKRRFSVVQVMNMPDFLVFSALIPKLSGARIVLYILDNMPEIMVASRSLGPQHPIVRLLEFEERVSALLADRIIVTQEMARQVVLARGVSERKVSVVLNCPNDKVFKGSGTNVPRDPGEAFEILTHGTILERWGIQVLIDALPRIAREVPQVRARIIGRGEYLPDLQQLAQKKGVLDRVEFLDWVPVDDLPGNIARADVGYVGVLFGMALSNKLLEYAASGLPIVVSRWPTHEHYFPEGTVTYFQPGDTEDLAAAVIQVYRDPTGAKARARRAARLYREQYSWAVQRQSYLGLYADLIAGPQVKRGDGSIGRLAE
jgi:glycosyltransferase involved in cell wall biosynthesis